MSRVLRSDFFETKYTAKIAQDLLGKFLIRKIGRKTISYMITEAEAYCGSEDKASHAHKGKTKRNEPMFGSAGNWYVYLIYGMYHMLNIVTGPKNYPAAILIRGLEGTCPVRSRSPQGDCSTAFGRAASNGMNGPGKLTKKLKITKVLNNKKAIPKNGLWIEDRGVKINKKDIKKSARIGVGYAGPVWSKKKLRFFICHSALDAESRKRN
ncbi:MAG: DNA-3-methyladenine glycosylase [bacterium]|nr:DNA-3-methyladenine glycosylase [bacterium]